MVLVFAFLIGITIIRITSGLVASRIAALRV
jgi:hypothetical protein